MSSAEAGHGALPPIDITPAFRRLGFLLDPRLDALTDQMGARLAKRFVVEIATDVGYPEQTAEELRKGFKDLATDFIDADDPTDAPEDNDFLLVARDLYRGVGRDIDILPTALQLYRADVRQIFHRANLQTWQPERVWPPDVDDDPRLQRRLFWVMYGMMVADFRRHLPKQREGDEF